MSVKDKTIVDVMYERHTVRTYSNQNIDPSILEKIIKAAGSAPSAWNLQHWKFVVVQQPENKQKVSEAAYGQKQIADAAAVVIVLGDTQADRNAETIYSEAVKAGYMNEQVKQTILGNIKRAYENVPNIGVHAAIQNSSYAAMQLMLAAKAEGIDSNPIGGFDANRLREVLSVPDRYIPTLIITLGYGAAPAHGSQRFPIEDILVHETF